MAYPKRVSLSFPVYRDLSNAVGLSRTGAFFGAGAGGADAPFNDVEIHVQKGRGQYAGQGGFLTTLASLLAKGLRMALPHAKNIFQASKPLIKDAAKSYAKQKVKEKADVLLGTGRCGCGPGEGAGMRLAHGSGGMRLGAGMRVAAQYRRH